MSKVNLDDMYTKENLITRKEYLSPSRRYKLWIDIYKSKNGSNCTKGSMYSVSINEFCGEVKRECPDFPFLFFKKGNKEYLISGSTYTTQTIIDCNIGHIYENRYENDFCWNTISQVDENMICVYGYYMGNDSSDKESYPIKSDEQIKYMFKFFNFSDLISQMSNMN
jgi:hypothetical protein